MQAEVGQISDIGKVRKRNEDALAVRWITAGGPILAVVADGIGGGRRGDEASGAAIRVIEERVPSALAAAGEALQADTVSGILKIALDDANAAVRAAAQGGVGKSGMGTTCVAAVAWDDCCTLRHVGDSRGYLLRDRRFSQITQDHARVQEFRRGGEPGRPDTGTPQLRLVITRALGLERAVESDEHRLDVRDGDTLLLCTDGLTGMLADADIESILASAPSAQVAADRLVAEANARGGTDNTTVIVIRFGAFECYEVAARKPAARQPAAWVDDEYDDEPGARPAARNEPRRPSTPHRAGPRGVHPGYLLVALAVGVLLGYLLRGMVAPPAEEPAGPAMTSGGQAP